MPRPPAVSNDSFVDADVCAQAGSTIERHFSVEQLPRLQEAGALDGSRIEVQLRFSLFDDRPAVDGTLRGTVRLGCQRCLQPVALPIEEQFQVILVQQESAEEPGGYEPVTADPSHFDVRWLAEEQALLALPLVPLHAVGECDEAAAPPQDIDQNVEQGTSPGTQRPFQNLRDLLEK
jgi:uncharacterized protein